MRPSLHCRQKLKFLTLKYKNPINEPNQNASNLTGTEETDLQTIMESILAPKSCQNTNKWTKSTSKNGGKFSKKKNKNPIDLGPKVQVREIKTGGILQRLEEKEEIGLDWEKEKEKVKWRACDDGWRDRWNRGKRKVGTWKLRRVLWVPQRVGGLFFDYNLGLAH